MDHGGGSSPENWCEGKEMVQTVGVAILESG